MRAMLKRDRSLHHLGLMRAVVIDHLTPVDIQLRPIVGKQRESPDTFLLYPKTSFVINREPFRAPGDAGKALFEILRRNIQAGRYRSCPLLRFFKVRQARGSVAEVVDLPSSPAG